MTNVRGLAEQATAAALRLRIQQKRGLFGSICPYDLALDMGLEVRFEAIPTLEGIYRPGASPLILLSSLRPSGRRAYNCAHELGHHVFNHGTSIDVLLDRAHHSFEPAEYLADRFAAALLLPQVAVLRAFAARGWAVEESTPVQMFTIARYFGVGYATLVGYLESTLMTLSVARAQELRRSSPKSIRRELLGIDMTDGDAIVLDEHWEGRSIDIEVGDRVVLPKGGRTRGACLAPDVACSISIARAVRPGIGTIESAFLPVAVRVCRRGYRGLAEYRFDEDPDAQES